MNQAPFPHIVFFDDDCVLCNRSVWFIIGRMAQASIAFASLQGDTADRLLSPYGTVPKELKGVVLLSRGKIYRDSTAALHICLLLRFPWKLLFALIIIPPFIRNVFYHFIARNRYRWFGKKHQCILPPDGLKAHFLT
jgi:predicted DCC family thiol-disulfide oxidoreductase YuxK